MIRRSIVALVLSFLWSSTAVMAAPILDALKNGDQPRLRELLAASADVDAKDNKGQTPLQMAAGEHTAQALLAAGADVNVQTKMVKRAGRAPAERGSREEQVIARIGRALCRSYTRNNFARMQKILRKSSQRLLGRVVELEEAYPHIRCYEPIIGDLDLLRSTAENPIASGMAVKQLMHYLVHEAQDKALLGRVATCKKDFGHSCLNLLEHIEESLKMYADLPQSIKILNSFKRLLHKNLNKANLKYDREFCQQYLAEPKRCSSETP